MIVNQLGCAFAIAASAQHVAKVDEEAIALASKHALSAVELATGVKLRGRVKVVVSTPEKLAEVLRAGLVERLIRFGLGEEEARQRAAEAARIKATSLLAKYDSNCRQIHVCIENLARWAGLSRQPLLLTSDGLIVLMAHEFTHAADDLAHGIGQTAAGLKAPEAIFAFAAVTEGHAQFVARRIARENGWMEAFSAYLHVMCAPPFVEVGDEGSRIQIHAASIERSILYRNGEQFIKAVHAKEGVEGIARVLKDPPGELLLICHPEWFLDSSRRPAPETDLKRALESAVTGFSPSDWAREFPKHDRARLTAAYGLLPESVRKRAVDSVAHYRGIRLYTKNREQQGIVYVGLVMHSSPGDAAHALAAKCRLLRLRDERMRLGRIRVETARYERIYGSGWEGEYFHKTFKRGKESASGFGLHATHGCFDVEITFTQVPVSRARMISMLERLLLAVHSPKALKLEKPGR